MLFLRYAHIPQHNTYSILVYFLFISLLNLRKERKYYTYIFFGILLTLLISFFLSHQVNVLFIITILSMILMLMLKRLISEAGNTLLVDSFILGLILYVITLILKMFFILLEMPNSIVFFHLTSAFEILFAIFFTIFHDNDDRLQIKLTKRKSAVNT